MLLVSHEPTSLEHILSLVENVGLHHILIGMVLIWEEHAIGKEKLNNINEACQWQIVSSSFEHLILDSFELIIVTVLNIK